MFELVLIAQMTADYPCWMDFGYGLVNMSYLCGQSAPAAPAAPMGDGLLEAFAAPTPELGVMAARYASVLPTVEECVDRQTNLYIASDDLVLDNAAYDRLVTDCANGVEVVGAFTRAGVQLQIIEDREFGDFWVRESEARDGYGPFGSRADAQAWAAANFQQFF